MAKNSSRTFGVIGLGNFGSTVATELQRFGNHVIGIDISEARVAQHAEKLSQAMIVDARDDLALREAPSRAPPHRRWSSASPATGPAHIRLSI
jgi:trk system potassium uptake protein TrkA